MDTRPHFVTSLLTLTLDFNVTPTNLEPFNLSYVYDSQKHAFPDDTFTVPNDTDNSTTRRRLS